MTARRVVVTGLGAVSAVGHDVPALWDALTACRSGIAPITLVDTTALHFSHGAEVKGWDPAAHFDRRLTDHLDRFAQFGAVATREAVRMAGIEWSDPLRERAAIVTGCCLGGRISEHREVQALLQRGGRGRAHPLAIPRGMENAGASQMAIEWGIVGPVYTVATACASSNHAIGQAFHLVRSGQVDLALAGGHESPFSPWHVPMWDGLRAVASDTCRPFSRDRKGMILGEGGATLVLELLDLARARGATPLAEVVGFGMSADADHITRPSVDGPARAIRAALRDAGLDPAQVGHVNAHGTGTQANDPTEAAALRQVFGERAGAIPVSATKSIHGHALGASGALEAVATVLALRHQLLPPTANFLGPDPECAVDLVTEAPRAAAVEYAISNAFAFGGLNAVLAFRRYDG